MFVARVDGKSMEPRIPDSAYCVFRPDNRHPPRPNRPREAAECFDPDTGQRFTVKCYRSEKTTNEDGWRHLSIVLEPLNPDTVSSPMAVNRGLSRLNQFHSSRMATNSRP